MSRATVITCDRCHYQWPETVNLGETIHIPKIFYNNGVVALTINLRPLDFCKTCSESLDMWFNNPEGEVKSDG